MKTISKKELKNLVNKKGFFAQMKLNVETNAPEALKDKIPEGGTYFEGIASTGELNRNGYIIRESAWVEAINNYFLNPIILLQHDIDQPIGRALTAVVTNGGLKVSGYIFDDLTENKFSKGLYSALSTGHFTEEVEFENNETGEILTEEQFAQLPYEVQFSGDWLMAVTKLDWVEFSLVTIGSNKKSLVTHKNAIMKRLNINEVEEVKEEVISEEETTEEITEEVVEEKGGEEEVSENDTDAEPKGEEVEPSEEPGKEGETPESSEEVAAETENDEAEADEEEVNEEEAESQNKVKVSKEQYDRLQNASKTLLKTLNAVEVGEEQEESEDEEEKEEEKKEDLSIADRAMKILSNDTELKDYFTNLVEVSLTRQAQVNALQEENKTLKEQLANTPERKRVLFSSQDKTISKEDEESKKNTPIVNLLKTHGVL